MVAAAGLSNSSAELYLVCWAVSALYFAVLVVSQRGPVESALLSNKVALGRRVDRSCAVSVPEILRTPQGYCHSGDLDSSGWSTLGR